MSRTIRTSDYQNAYGSPKLHIFNLYLQYIWKQMLRKPYGKNIYRFSFVIQCRKKGNYHSFWKESTASVDGPVLVSYKPKKNSFQQIIFKNCYHEEISACRFTFFIYIVIPYVKPKGEQFKMGIISIFLNLWDQICQLYCEWVTQKEKKQQSFRVQYWKPKVSKEGGIYF